MYNKLVKRFFDFIISLLAMPFVMIFIAIFGLAILFTDHGSIFYTAPRRGYKGKTFNMIKLRSMYVNSPELKNEDGSTYSGRDDPRVTKVGRFMRKFSIDEVPQIINVLKGDMSFVGPRPHLAKKPLEELPESHLYRLQVRPGITGYAQAYFRNSIDQETKVKYDNYYVDNISLGLDIKILFHTVFSVLGAKNIDYQESHL